MNGNVVAIYIRIFAVGFNLILGEKVMAISMNINGTKIHRRHSFTG